MITNTEKPFACNLKFFFLFIGLFVTEVLIAKYMHDTQYIFGIRNFWGDVLVVVLIYAFVRSFFNGNYRHVAVGVLIFSFLIEILQAFNLVKMLGFERNTFMRIALGSTFSYYDLLAYFIGFLVCLGLK